MQSERKPTSKPKISHVLIYKLFIMKKSILPILLCLFYSLSSFSQFELTKDGLTVIDSDKDYIVYEFQGKSKEDLYTSVLKTLTVKYNSAKDVLSKVENEALSINGLENNYLKGKKALGIQEVWSLSYNLNIHFRDGKIKIDAPIISFPENYEGRNLHLSKGGIGRVAIFKNGKLKEEDIKRQIEDFFNNLVSEIKHGVENEKDDW